MFLYCSSGCERTKNILMNQFSIPDLSHRLQCLRKSYSWFVRLSREQIVTLDAISVKYRKNTFWSLF